MELSGEDRLFDQSHLDEILDGVRDPRHRNYLTNVYREDIRGKYRGIVADLGLTSGFKRRK
jgi:hypothetical protein